MAMFRKVRADSEKVWKFIEDFLKEEDGVVLEKIDDPDSEWRYFVEYPKDSEVRFEVFRPKGKSLTLIVTGLNLTDDMKKALESVKDVKIKILTALSVTFWVSDVLFDFYPNLENLERVDFAAKIYDEELDRPTLFKTFRRLEGFKRTVAIHLQILMSTASPTPQPLGMFL